MGEKHGGELSKNPFKLIKLKSGFTQSYYSVQSSVTKSPFKKGGFLKKNIITNRGKAVLRPLHSNP
jgi:hypothetical protein